MDSRSATFMAAGIWAVLVCTPGAADEKGRTDSVHHVVVYSEPGHFAAWPANHDIWVWKNEILVGFSLGDYKENTKSHSVDRDKRVKAVFARSLDGGEIWKLEDPDHFVGDGGVPVPNPTEVEFTNPNLLIRVGGPPPFHEAGNTFFVSVDRGKTWRGPYLFAGLEKFDLTARTDYLVNGQRSAFFFLSANQPGVRAGDHHDRAFFARTTDGGRSYQFVSWITHDSARSVMPSSARLSRNELITALRRRADEGGTSRNWIDVYASTDNGATWTLRGKVSDTGQAQASKNGNPPALLRLRDGRLVVTYGYRSEPYGMRARISRDSGRTWDKEIVLSTDGAKWDLGYSRSVQRADGKVVTVYYNTTAENPEQHIVAAIWDPRER